jgi:uncharacterized protein involved in exopolysaccharide biosynthesis
VWHIIWRDRLFVLIVIAMSVGTALLYLLNARDWYRAEVVLQPLKNAASNDLSGRFGEFTDLLGTVNSDNTDESIAVLKSREFTADFIADQNLLPVLFSRTSNFWLNRVKNFSVSKQPDLGDGVEYFDTVVRKVSKDRRTGLVKISIQWTDPVRATLWANLLAERINRRMREVALEESRRKVAFIENQMASSDVVALRDSLGRILDRELKILVATQETGGAAFKILDRAEMPKCPYAPPVILVLFLAFSYGFLGSAVVLFVKHVARGAAM